MVHESRGTADGEQVDDELAETDPPHAGGFFTADGTASADVEFVAAAVVLVLGGWTLVRVGLALDALAVVQTVLLAFVLVGFLLSESEGTFARGALALAAGAVVGPTASALAVAGVVAAVLVAARLRRVGTDERIREVILS